MDHIRSLGSNGSRICRFVILTCLLCCVVGVHALAGAEAGKRHFKIFIRPEYPQLAKQLKIKGTVRIQLRVSPDGRIMKTKVLGGSPLLVQAVVDAVRKWKYEPADVESIEIVKFDFDPMVGAR